MAFDLRSILTVAVALAGAALVYAIGGAGAGFVAALTGLAVAIVAARPAAIADSTRDVPAADPSPVLGEVLDLIVEPVLLVEQGRVAFANRAATALLGGHIVDEDIRVAIRHPAAAERLAALDADVAQRPIELVGIGTLDQRWEMRIGATSDGRRIVHLVDQTRNYAAERMRVDFVANASHELRTPLASILGFIETLGDEAGEVPALRNRFLKVMFDEARRMQRLVEDLISLSRIEAEKYRPPGESIDLAALVTRVCGELHASASPRAADLDCMPDGDVPPIAGDRAQLSQMLHNLVGNAMKYGRPGTPVRVRLTADANRIVHLTIADEGEGIAPEHIPRLTERFYRVDAGRSRTLGGTGLGLAIVKHIVERHRGRLDMASTPGVGTTVTVSLPIESSKRNTNVTQAVAAD